jgi:hypothetical protein
MHPPAHPPACTTHNLRLVVGGGGGLLFVTQYSPNVAQACRHVPPNVGGLDSTCIARSASGPTEKEPAVASAIGAGAAVEGA